MKRRACFVDTLQDFENMCANLANMAPDAAEQLLGGGTGNHQQRPFTVMRTIPGDTVKDKAREYDGDAYRRI